MRRTGLLIASCLLSAMVLAQDTELETPTAKAIAKSTPVSVAPVPLPVEVSPPVKEFAPIVSELQSRFEEGRKSPLASDDSAIRSGDALTRFFESNDYAPVWTEKSGPKDSAKALLLALEQSGKQGLRPENYHVNDLRKRIASSDHGTANRADLEILLSDAFLTYGRHLLRGSLNPKLVDKEWELVPREADLVQVLNEALANNRVFDALNKLAPGGQDYPRMQSALQKYKILALAGGWSEVSQGKKLQLKSSSARVKELRARLGLPIGKVPPEGVDPDHVFDEAVDTAIRDFQARHGLLVDGIVGRRTVAALNVSAAERVRQIEVNLERLRWMPADLGARHIQVDIADYKMRVIEEGKPVMDASVVVGRSKRPTPVFTGEMSYLVLNPYWNVPYTIAVEDMLPKLQNDPYALAAKGIRVFESGAGGAEIDPGNVDWNSVSKSTFWYRLRQDPGSRNSLGRIKFMFPNRHAVYLHDTPSRNLFNRNARAFSSGCVRVSKPYELAEYLLKGSERWNRSAIEKASRGNRERTVKLPENIPVHLLYRTAWADEDGTVHFRTDIYGRDVNIAKALVKDSAV